MELFTFLYLSMILSLSICMVMIIKEGKRLHWSKLAKWLAIRMVGIYTGVIVMIMALMLFPGETDIMMQCVIFLAVLSICVLLVLHLPEILKNMSNDELAEDLNVKEYNHSDDIQAKN